MSDDLKLSLPERALLLILMAENTELSNPQIEEQFASGLKLTGKNRLKLQKAELVESRKGERGAYFFALGEKGWSWCRDELSRELPAGSGSAGQALYSVLRGLDRYLGKNTYSLANVFAGEPAAGPAPAGEPVPAPAPVAAAEPVPADVIELLVRRTYKKLASSAGGWVGLADLRDQLAEVSRAELDGVLRLMARLPGVRIEEETNQKALTPRDRAAAVTIGPRDQHVLAIESL